MFFIIWPLMLSPLRLTLWSVSVMMRFVRTGSRIAIHSLIIPNGFNKSTTSSVNKNNFLPINIQYMYCTYIHTAQNWCGHSVTTFIQTYVHAYLYAFYTVHATVITLTTLLYCVKVDISSVRIILYWLRKMNIVTSPHNYLSIHTFHLLSFDFIYKN